MMCSDHAQLMVTIKTDVFEAVSTKQLLERASNLDLTFTYTPRTTNVSRDPHHDEVDMGAFVERMEQCEPSTLSVVNEENVNVAIKETCKEVNRIAKECNKTNIVREGSVELRWKRIMEENDWKNLESY